MALSNFQGLLVFVIILAIAIVLAAVVWWKHSEYVLFMNFDNKVFNHQPGDCSIVHGTEQGSEGFFLLGNGLALITTGYRAGRRDQEPWKSRKGNILVFDFNNAEAGAKGMRIEGHDMDPCSPLGLSVLKSANESYLVHVTCSYPDGVETVEVFSFSFMSPSQLIYIRTIQSEEFSSLNSITHYSEDDFFFTNFMYGASWLSLKLRIKMGGVGICRKSECETLEDLCMPNGITLSLDKRFLYVSVIGENSIRVYQVNDDLSIQIVQTFIYAGKADNLNIDPVTGDLWTGGIPSLSRCFESVFDPKKRGPSQVLRFETHNGLIVRTHELYSVEEGESSSSAAVYYNRKLLIGSPVGRAVLCHVQYMP